MSPDILSNLDSVLLEKSNQGNLKFSTNLKDIGLDKIIGIILRMRMPELETSLGTVLGFVNFVWDLLRCQSGVINGKFEPKSWADIQFGNSYDKECFINESSVPCKFSVSELPGYDWLNIGKLVATTIKVFEQHRVIQDYQGLSRTPVEFFLAVLLELRAPRSAIENFEDFRTRLEFVGEPFSNLIDKELRVSEIYRNILDEYRDHYRISLTAKHRAELVRYYECSTSTNLIRKDSVGYAPQTKSRQTV